MELIISSSRLQRNSDRRTWILQRPSEASCETYVTDATESSTCRRSTLSSGTPRSKHGCQAAAFGVTSLLTVGNHGKLLMNICDCSPYGALIPAQRTMTAWRERTSSSTWGVARRSNKGNSPEVDSSRVRWDLERRARCHVNIMPVKQGGSTQLSCEFLITRIRRSARARCVNRTGSLVPWGWAPTDRKKVLQAFLLSGTHLKYPLIAFFFRPSISLVLVSLPPSLSNATTCAVRLHQKISILEPVRIKARATGACHRSHLLVEAPRLPDITAVIPIRKVTKGSCPFKTSRS